MREEAAKFRQEFLESNDEVDQTDIWDESWDSVRRDITKPDALGGPYIAVHLRRKDFLYARKKELPSLKGAAKEIKKQMELHGVGKAFIATDGVQGEREEMKKLLGANKVSIIESLSKI